MGAKEEAADHRLGIVTESAGVGVKFFELREMEHHIATNITDALVPGLDFRGGAPSAEYVKQARQVRWRAQAGDRFSNAAKTIRFNLSDDCWLQSQTLRLQFSIARKSGTTIL